MASLSECFHLSGIDRALATKGQPQQMSYYSTPIWRELRLSILERDQWTCQECDTKISGRSAHVHHILPRALGGQDSSENLTSLCEACHGRRHLSLHVSLSERFLQTAAIRLAKLFGDKELKSLNLQNMPIALRILGIKRLRKHQLAPIISALSGNDILLISPTGSGKSVCFQVPALLSNRASIVLSPLKALMADQVSKLLQQHIPVTFLNSDLSHSEKKRRVKLIKDGLFRLIYMAPEQLYTSKHSIENQRLFADHPPHFLIVDEAHCIDKWGDSFRPSYEKIGEIRKQLGSPPTLAFTATANKKTREEILRSLHMENAKIFIEDLDRDNLAVLRMRMQSHTERAKIINNFYSLMRTKTSGKCLIFVATLKQGHLVQQLLSNHGMSANFFHSQCSKTYRENIIEEFKNGATIQKEIDPNILICTNAFGMGMDIPNIRLVFHWHHPSSIEDYVQEFGRAGRDGKQSLAILFTGSDDKGLLNFLAEKSIYKNQTSPLLRLEKINRRKSLIDSMNNMATDHSICINKKIISTLGEEKTSISKISNFFLSLAFTRKQKNKKRVFCCDGCWRKENSSKVSSFGIAVINSMDG